MSSSVNLTIGEKTFLLGDSAPAKAAIVNYEAYQLDHNYVNLKNCFAHLYDVVWIDPSYKKAACHATHRLALSVFHSTSNIHEQFFFANSVSSIIVAAQLE